MTDLMNSTAIAAIVESFRKEMIDVVNRAADDLLDTLSVDSGPHPVMSVKIPTLAQCQDPANKTENGVNLTERGVEILYRLFDDGAGYNRASKSLGITQTAARHRKGAWEKAGGRDRVRKELPGID